MILEAVVAGVLSIFPAPHQTAQSPEPFTAAMCPTGFKKAVATTGAANRQQILSYLHDRFSCDKIRTGKRAFETVQGLLHDGHLRRDEIDLFGNFLRRQLAEDEGMILGEVPAVISAAAILVERLQLSTEPAYHLLGEHASLALSGQLAAASKVTEALNRELRAQGKQALF